MGLHPPRKVWLRANPWKAAYPSRPVIKRAPKRLSRAPSVWFAVALFILISLEFTSGAGPILERYDADILVGWLGQLVLLSLLIEALMGSLPRVAMLIPIMFYVSYYLAFWWQGVHVKLESDELRKTNPKLVLEFNAKQHSLVIEQADIFAATHAIPVVYARDLTYIRDGYVSYRLIARDMIKEYLSINADGVQVLSVDWGARIQSNVRILAIQERPPGKVITASVYDYAGEGSNDWNIGVKTTSLNVDGHVIGIFKSGYVRRLPIIPIFKIGCKFSLDPPSRRCRAEFATDQMSIESRPDFVDRALYPDPISIMLGIKGLSQHEVANYRNSDFGADPPVRAAPGEDAAFEALQAIIDGRSPPLSWRTSFLIASNPSRLGRFAVAMTKRFLDLSQVDAFDAPGKLLQVSVLAAGIEALGPAEFGTVQDLLSDAARRDRSLLDKYPLLYLRLADVGPKMYSIYRDQFLAHSGADRERVLALLAICRIGQADSELISVINSEWAKVDSGGLKDRIYQSALFVTLLKLGQEGEVKNFSRQNSPTLQGWYEAVLAGRGKTDVGPNNCMPIEWPEATDIPAFLAPSLKWVNERWAPGD